MSGTPFQLPIDNISEISKQSSRMILLTELPPNEALSSPAPTKEFIEDIGLRGQLDPIWVTEIDNKYVVISGRRRIKALRELNDADPTKWNKAKALVFTNIDLANALNLSAVENNLRSDNPLTDYIAITQLLEKNPGISEHEISRQTGIPISRIKKRLKLKNLKPEFYKLFSSGEMTVSTAENIAKMSPTKQDKLFNIYIQKGKVSGDDVHEVQQATVQENVNKLPVFPEIDTLDQEKILEYVHIKEGMTDRVTFTNIKDALAYKLINGGTLYKLVEIE